MKINKILFLLVIINLFNCANRNKLSETFFDIHSKPRIKTQCNIEVYKLDSLERGNNTVQAEKFWYIVKMRKNKANSQCLNLDTFNRLKKTIFSEYQHDTEMEVYYDINYLDLFYRHIGIVNRITKDTLFCSSNYAQWKLDNKYYSNYDSMIHKKIENILEKSKD